MTDGGRTKKAWISISRSYHLLRIHAGSGNGERSFGGMLSPSRAGRKEIVDDEWPDDCEARILSAFRALQSLDNEPGPKPTGCWRPTSVYLTCQCRGTFPAGITSKRLYQPTLFPLRNAASFPRNVLPTATVRSRVHRWYVE